MEQRLDYFEVSAPIAHKYADFSGATHASAVIEPALRELVDLRVSQLNGCAFCVDMHVKVARKHGERELRLHHVAIWRESPLFTARERAGLLWAEQLTRLSPEGVSDEIYNAVRATFSEQEICDLTFAVMAINGWNRACIAFRTAPGSKDEAFALTGSGLD
jgi:AhpD family alkylhydroperoxidase